MERERERISACLVPSDCSCWLALLVLSNAASFVLCVFCRVKDHHKLLHDSSSLKKTCVRQGVLDE